MEKSQRFLFLLFFFVTMGFPITGFATPLSHSSHVPYYGEDFFQDNSRQGNLTHLHRILNAYHFTRKGHYDEILDQCPSQQGERVGPPPVFDHLEEVERAKRKEGPCFRHRILSYNLARKMILSRLHLEHDSHNGYFLRDVYCQQNLTEEDFPEDGRPSPHQTPDASIINVEHTWPQSHFRSAPGQPLLMQKSDLHHLYPVRSNINSTRSNHPFGEVKVYRPIPSCPSAKLGTLKGDDSKKYFEPASPHRGNLARALFYFSVKYRRSIDPVEETFLRKWHKEDPVNNEEKIRNEDIFALEGVRNPFIDYPRLTETIKDF